MAQTENQNWTGCAFPDLCANLTLAGIDPSSLENEEAEEQNGYNSTDEFYYYTPVEELFVFYLWRYATPCIFAAIMAVGTVGNFLVIYVMLTRQELRSMTNLLLVNLALADIAFLWICVPFTAYKYAADGWPFGDFVCKIFQYFVYVATYVTIYTLVAISGLRFVTVVCGRNTARLRTRRNAILLAMGIWIVTLTANIPTLLAHTVKISVGYIYCGIELNAIGPVLFSFFVLGYALPLTLICVLYIFIVHHLYKNKPATLDQSKCRERNSRALKVIVLVVVVFGVSWLPMHVQSILGYYRLLPEAYLYEILRVLWNCMAYGNSCANPFIYHYGSKEFRRCLRELACLRCIMRGKSSAKKDIATEKVSVIRTQQVNSTLAL